VDGNVISNQTNLGDALAVGMIVVAGVAMSGYLIAQRRANRWRAA
jgi:putative spermidine/putrescine transport system permease protein